MNTLIEEQRIIFSFALLVKFSVWMKKKTWQWISTNWDCWNVSKKILNHKNKTFVNSFQRERIQLTLCWGNISDILEGFLVLTLCFRKTLPIRSITAWIYGKKVTYLCAPSRCKIMSSLFCIEKFVFELNNRLCGSLYRAN